jgi:Flp pilus assembly protein TadG
MTVVITRGASCLTQAREPRQLWVFPVSTLGLDRLLRNRRGNVAMMYALVAPVLVFAGGAAIDYGRTAQIHTKLNAAADAAALAALTPTMLQQSNQTAQDASKAMFQGLTEGIPGLTVGATQVTVSVTNVANTLIRDVSVTYSTSVNTIFAQVLGKSALPVSGSSQASAQASPNIDFYVLLDNSPSMALPATDAGITLMQSLTQNQTTGGCAFACHQANTSYNTTTPTSSETDTVYNPCADGTSPTLPLASSPITINSVKYTKAWCDVSKGHVQLDNYALARKNNITLRLDELNSGVSTLLQTASTASQSSTFATPPKYRFSIYSLDSLWQISLTKLMALTSNYTSGWTTAAANFGVMEMYSNNSNCANAACSSSTNAGGDVATNYDTTLGTLSQASSIPNPGDGTNEPGDTPQEILFIVTDGVEDEQSGSRRLEQTINDLGGDPSASPYGNVKGTNWCTAIKNRNIKIAILYTDYLKVPANNWYVTHIDPFQSQISADLAACATPGLFIDEANDTNIGRDLANLFNLAATPGHLTQ